MSDDDFRDELLDTLRESDPGEVVVADQAAGSVRTLPEFPVGGAVRERIGEGVADQIGSVGVEDVNVESATGRGVPSCRHGKITDACPVCGHSDEEEPGVIDSIEAASELIKDTDIVIEPKDHRRQYATLTFAEEHVGGILAADKTVTLRLPDAYDQAVVHAAERGAEVLLVTSDGQPFARARMCAVWAATARQVCGAALSGHPTDLASPDDVLRVLERHYGDELADADPAEAVDVVHFDVVEAYRGVSES